MGKLVVQEDGTSKSERRTLNFVEGTNVTITITDDVPGNQADIQIDAAGGAAAVSTDTIWDTKGDIAAATGPDAAVVLPVGTDTQVLTADSAEVTGLKWAAAGGGAPATVDYLVGTADAGLSGEIVVGTSPGGELGGTWASPTVDATHSGSAHHTQSHGNADHTTAFTDDTVVDAHIADTLDAHDASAVSVLDSALQITATDVEGALAEIVDASQAHEAAADPHTGYRLESADHTHATTGLQGGTVAYADITGTPAAERAASTTSPANIGTAAVGTGTTDARDDHVHATGAGAPSTQALGDAAAVGTGPAAAMTDHKHAMPTAAVTTSGLTQATNKLLGRGTAATGAIEEITLGTNLSFTGTTLNAAGGTGAVATDVIWDAKGDLAGGTGADTAIALTVGANDTVLTADSAQATGMKWATPGAASHPGYATHTRFGVD